MEVWILLTSSLKSPKTPLTSPINRLLSLEVNFASLTSAFIKNITAAITIEIRVTKSLKEAIDFSDNKDLKNFWVKLKDIVLGAMLSNYRQFFLLGLILFSYCPI